jgi:hypothetical protein
MAVVRNGSRARIGFRRLCGGNREWHRHSGCFLSDLNALVKRRAGVPHNPGSLRLTKNRLKKYCYFFFLAAFLAGFFAAFFFAAIVLYLLNVVIWTR